MTMKEMTTTHYLRKELGGGQTMQEYVKEWRRLTPKYKKDLHEAAELAMKAEGIKIKPRDK
jgi:hypothetical protein